MTKITPIFAAFCFRSIPNGRAAWKACDGNPDVREVSVWSASLGGLSVVTILGEDQERVDATAKIVGAQPGCLGNYVLNDMLKRFYTNRRYGTLSAELFRRLGAGETVEEIKAAGGLKQRSSDQP